MVRQATDTAVSASISTPVGPVTLTVARTVQPASLASAVMSSSTLESASGWQSGISSEVRLAAMMPAMRAVPSTSPFLALPETISSSVALLMTTRPSAIATRSVAGFAETSTIRASPLLSIWVSEAPVLGGFFGIALARSGGARCFAAGQQRPRRRGHIGLPHQAFADQEGRHAHASQPRQVCRREDAALADHQPVARNQRRQRLAGFQRGLEGAEIAVVYADHRRSQLQRAIEFGTVVDLKQHVHPVCDCGVLDVNSGGIVE